MRIVLYITFGFAFACAVGAYGAGGSLLLACGLTALLAGGVCLLFKRKGGYIAFVVLLGVFLGSLWSYGYDQIYLNRLRSFDGKTVSACVTVTDYSYTNYYGISAEGRIQLDGKTYRIRLYVDETDYLQPGDQVKGEIKLMTTAAGGAAESDYQQSSGLFLVGYVQSGAQYGRAQWLAVQYYPVAFRNYVTGLLDRCFPADTLPFVRALLLGDTSLLNYQEDTDYKTSGIRHVVAVSGLHVSILFALLYILAGKRRVLTALIGLPVLFLFAAVAGFTPSVVRACTMQALIVLALLLNKEYDPPTALAGAVLLILLWNPMAVMSVSLQLSAGCMAGIFLFSSRISEWAMSGKLGIMAKGKDIRGRIVRWAVGSVSATLGAMSLTAPLSAYYFGTVSLVCIITNLLCLWVISFVFYGIMLACIAALIWLPAGQMIAWIVSIPVRFVKWISALLADIPFAAVYTCSGYIVIWLILSYCLIITFLFWKKKRPALLVSCVILSLVMAIGASWLEPVAGNYLVTVMDVGQGQCVLLRCGNQNYLVDCGGEHPQQTADKAANLLLSQGISCLDGIIVTHYDADHVNGVRYLMHRVPADRLYLPDVADHTDIRSQLTEAFSDRITWITEDAKLTGADWMIQVYTGQPGKEGNESSLCVLFQRQNCDILITGDRSIESENALLEAYDLPKLELLVVGHHGSQSSTGFALLAHTKPAWAVISVGKDNRYDHPSHQTLMRLERGGCKILRTDINGDIHFRR